MRLTISAARRILSGNPPGWTAREPFPHGVTPERNRDMAASPKTKAGKK